MCTDAEENFMVKKPFICKGNIYNLIIYNCYYDFEET